MYVCVLPFLALLLYAQTKALIHDGAYPGSETNTKPPEMSTFTSNFSAGPEDLVVTLTNATFPSVTTTHENKVMDSTAFPVKIFEPPPSKRTEREPPMGKPRMEPTGRNGAISPIPKPHDDITLPPMDQAMEFKTSMVTGSIILSSTTEVTNISPELTKNIINVAPTSLYTYSHQDTSKLISSWSTPTSKPQANTALPGFTADWGSTGYSDTIIPSTTKGVISIQPEFTKNIIDVAPTILYTQSHIETTQPISSLSTTTSKSQVNTALPGFTKDQGSTGPSGTIISSTSKGVTSIQPAFTKNIIDVAPTTVYIHSNQETSKLISFLSTPTSKPQANTALPGFTKDQGLTGPSGTLIPSTSKGVTSIQPEFTKNIIDVAPTTVYTHSHPETTQPISSLSTTTSKSQVNTALPRFTTDQGSTGLSGTIISSTSKGVTSIQPAFTKIIIDVAPTTVYTHSDQETSKRIASLSTPTLKPQVNIALPGFTTDWGSIGSPGTIIPSTTKGVSSIQPAFTKIIIDVAATTVYTHSDQETSKLIGSLSTPTLKPQVNTELPGFTTDWGSTGSSSTIIPSSTKGFNSIQPAFTKNIINIVSTTVYTHSHPETTSKPQAKTALSGFTTDQISSGPSGTLIPSTTIGITRIQPASTKNIIDVEHTAVYSHSQPISLSSTGTLKPQANTALPRFPTDWGSKGTSDIIIPSTTKGVTNIQPKFTKNIIDVALTAVYTHNPQETSQLMSSSYIPTSNIPSSSSRSTPVTYMTTATAMQETTWPTNHMPTTTREDATTALLTSNKTYPTIFPLNSKVSDPKPPAMTMAKTSVSFNSNNPGTMLTAITSTQKTLNVTGSCSPETKSAPMPPGTRDTAIPYSVTPPSSPAPRRSTYSRITADTSSTEETTEEQSSEITEIIEITDTIAENTLHPEIAVSTSGGRIILRVTMKSSPTTNLAVVMRELLQQTCLLLDHEIPAEDVTVSWSSQKMFLPCVTVMGIEF